MPKQNRACPSGEGEALHETDHLLTGPALPPLEINVLPPPSATESRRDPTEPGEKTSQRPAREVLNRAYHKLKGTTFDSSKTGGPLTETMASKGKNIGRRYLYGSFRRVSGMRRGRYTSRDL